MTVIITISNEIAMKEFGARLGALLRGGEVIEMVGDVGAGKTTLTKGIGIGLQVDDDVQSPSFTISRVYEARDGLQLAHYDFYRLHDAGIMADELHETIHDPQIVTIIEWAEVVGSVLPQDRLDIHITAIGEYERRVEILAHGQSGQRIIKELTV